MKKFLNLNIKTKLIGSFIVIAIFTGIVGFVGINNMNNMNVRSNAMYNYNFLPAQDLATIQTSLENVRANHLLALYERNEETLESRLSVIAELGTKTNLLLDHYKETIESQEDQTHFDTLLVSMGQYRDSREANLALIKEGNYEAALTTLATVTNARIKMDGELQQLIILNENQATNAIAMNAENFKTQSMVMIAVIIAGISLAIGLGYFLATIISKPLNKLVVVANQIADGNLDVEIDIHTTDEVGVLATAFKQMSIHINEVMSNIASASEQVASGAKQVSDSSMVLSHGATEQASSIEQLTASIEEIASQTRFNANNAQNANGLAVSAKDNAMQGNQQMQDMLKAMDEINESSSNISKIIKVIDDIAFQTNILALNAAVEAARAGQHGKGFSVVAIEVRNLAARSANAAKETTAMIEGSIRKVDDGTKLASETAKALHKIVEGIDKVAVIVGDISNASSEQAIGISQINQGISQVSQIVQANSATSEESAAASEELAGQADLLREQVSKFQLKKSFAKKANWMEEMSPEMRKMLESMYANQNNQRGPELARHDRKPKTIDLSDQEFGKY